MDNETQQDLTSKKMEDYGILQREVTDLLSLAFTGNSVIECYSSMSKELNEIGRLIHQKDETIKDLKMQLKKKTILGRVDHFIEKSNGYKIGFISMILSFLLSIMLIVLRNIQILQ